MARRGYIIVKSKQAVAKIPFRLGNSLEAIDFEASSRVWMSFFWLCPMTWPLTGSFQNGLLRPKP